MALAVLIGFLFGFVGSMPVAGPIAVLVFARGIEGRFRGALAIATGGAIAEAAYAFLAFWGFSTFLTKYTFIVPLGRGMAAAVLIALGIVFVRRRPAAEERKTAPVRDGWSGSLALGFTVTALNPTLIATWTAAATTLFTSGIVDFTPAMALPFALAACAGIVGWFGLLLFLVRRYKERFNTSTLNRVIQVMGVLLIALGSWFLILFVHYWIAGR